MNHDNTLNLAISLGLKFSTRIPESVKIPFIFLDGPDHYATENIKL